MARRRTSRGVNTRPMRSLVLDDVGALEPPRAGGSAPAPPLTGSLASRERLDERRRRWEAERARFRDYRASSGDPGAGERPPA